MFGRRVPLISVFLVAALTAASPAPSASPPLKIIIQVHSRALCTTLTQRIAPAIAGLMKDDELVDLGRKGVAKMGSDATAGSKSLKMDALGIENVVSALVHNIQTIDDILDAPAAFPTDPKTDDDRSAQAVKARLLVVLTRQKAVLNALYGLIDTQALGDMQTEGLSGIPTASNKSTYGASESDKAALDAAGLSVDPHEIDTRMVNSDLVGMTTYGRLAAILAQHEQRTSAIESDVASDVMQIATQCSGTLQP